jgi:CRISPR-associated protein Cas2
MVVIILESVSSSVRGELTRWLIELRAGVFVGNISAMVRDKLWEMICGKMKRKGGGFLIHPTNTEQGYAIYSVGTTTRVVEDFEGLLLVRTDRARNTHTFSTSSGS